MQIMSEPDTLIGLNSARSYSILSKICLSGEIVINCEMTRAKMRNLTPAATCFAAVGKPLSWSSGAVLWLIKQKLWKDDNCKDLSQIFSSF